MYVAFVENQYCYFCVLRGQCECWTFSFYFFFFFVSICTELCMCFVCMSIATQLNKSSWKIWGPLKGPKAGWDPGWLLRRLLLLQRLLGS